MCIKAHWERYYDIEAAKHDQTIGFIYILAGLMRTPPNKRLPEMDTFKVKKEDSPGEENKKAGPRINEDAILAWLMDAKAAHQERVKRQKKKE